MRSAAEVVAADLDHIARAAGDELAMMAGKRLVVVGGAGFLGHSLVQAPLAWNRLGRGAPIGVSVLDNFSRGVPPWLERLRGDPSLAILRHDVVDPVPEEIGEADYVVHAASIASPTFYRRHPIETMDANVGGLRRLLDFAVARARAGRPLSGFLYFSTSEIYGDPPPEQIPTPETFRGHVSCTGPRACYDESKRFGETLCVGFAQVHGVPVSIARPFNNYGPGLKITDGRVLPDFARDVMAGRDIVLLSDGAPTRTFCYVADAAAGYLKVLVRGRPGEAYNIGIEEPEISMAQLAERVAETARALFGYGGCVVRGASRDADYLVDNPNRRCPVIAKARTELGYAPTIGIEEGLRRALLWYGENRHGEDA